MLACRISLVAVQTYIRPRSIFSGYHIGYLTLQSMKIGVLEQVTTFTKIGLLNKMSVQIVALHGIHKLF